MIPAYLHLVRGLVPGSQVPAVRRLTGGLGFRVEVGNLWPTPRTLRAALTCYANSPGQHEPQVSRRTPPVLETAGAVEGLALAVPNSARQYRARVGVNATSSLFGRRLPWLTDIR